MNFTILTRWRMSACEFQAMACGLFGAKPLSEEISSNYQFGPLQQINSIQENTLKDVCKMVAIFSLPRCQLITYAYILGYITGAAIM